MIASCLDNWNTWSVSFDDRSKHEERFQSLYPVNGFLTGEQARNYFTQSKLPNPVLAQIWTLADVTVDGRLDKKEFSIAMFLIKKCLEGNALPPQLPPSLLQEPQRFTNIAVPLDPPLVPQPISQARDSGEWCIPASSKPKYKLQFNQNDRTKRGYLTGVEARGIFLKSNLPQSQLAAIW